MTRSVEGLPAPNERRRLREAAELTHDEVAAAVGVTANTVRSWESGRTAPRGRKREAYTKFLAGLPALPDALEAEAEAADPVAVAAGAPVLVAVTAGAEGCGTGTPEASAAPAAGTGTGTTAEPAAEPPAEAPAEAPAGASAGAPAEAPAEALAGGPAESFDALYAHAATDLARQTYLLTGRRNLALEAVERAFTQAWGRWPEVASDPDPVGWVRAAAYEYALSPWHRFRRAHRHADRPPAEPADRILLDALLALPAAHRRTVLLYDGVGLDLPDTAAETEASTPTAGLRLLHAHSDLADRVPELADVPPENQSAVLRALLAALRPAVALDPRPAAAVRGGGEWRTRLLTRATLGLTAVIAASTAYTAATAPRQYEPVEAPGQSVSGVPPLSGPQQPTDRSRQLRDKLLADPDAGPARISPKAE
ncbi:helix-turn-helix domain-containing protein [Streptomyces sp. NBC_01294]|uniref:helix-turn-helix domain-containing protein n=1 Tax=Streptomyces sp. NBC_01294 TaxID=2903815 RepID=UPI002DD9768E|nr:helix-turn-helix domain-containing protein [Streptomyces sp. NBC_01294]WRZ57529.1 helix-turn-helix domain-containing protein [Streptomyces sp. NBC_01294]